VEWLIALTAVGASVWMASQVLSKDVDEPERCGYCGSPVRLAEESVELVKQGVSNHLWADCGACGGSTVVSMGWGDEPEWLR
jgi:hypothetical protein